MYRLQSEYHRITMLPVFSEIANMQVFEIHEIQFSKQSGHRWTFHIQSDYCVYFMFVCTDTLSYILVKYVF